MFDFSGGHFKNGRQNPHTTRVNISASNPPKIEIFLSKYKFSGVLIKNKVFVNTLIQQNNKHFNDWPFYKMAHQIWVCINISASNPSQIEIFFI